MLKDLLVPKVLQEIQVLRVVFKEPREEQEHKVLKGLRVLKEEYKELQVQLVLKVL